MTRDVTMELADEVQRLKAEFRQVTQDAARECGRLRDQVESWQQQFCKVVEARNIILAQRDALLAAAKDMINAPLLHAPGDEAECVACVATDALRAAVAACEVGQ